MGLAAKSLCNQGKTSCSPCILEQNFFIVSYIRPAFQLAKLFPTHLKNRDENVSSLVEHIVVF